MNKRYVIHWKYGDMSDSGVFPKLLTEKEKDLLVEIERVIGFNKEIEFIDLKEQGE